MRATTPTTGKRPVVLLSYGLGKHSTAAAVELVENPSRRGFELDQLILLTAMTGNEWGTTKALVEEHLLPLLRHHGVRYVQVARKGPREQDGISVLSDTGRPERLYTEGVYKLSDELRRAGTVPTYCGTRKCSLKFKGWVINEWIRQNLEGADVRQIIGFHAGELYRVERERRYYSGERPPIEHPLIDWGWDNEACVEYLRGRFGVEWQWSACSFCMFSNVRPEVVERFKREPRCGAEAVVIERTDRILNPRITLYSRRSVEGLLRRDGNGEAIALADAEMDGMTWKRMRVRRIRYTKTLVHRRTDELARGTRSQMDKLLHDAATRRNLPLTDEGGHQRLYILRLPDSTNLPSARRDDRCGAGDGRKQVARELRAQVESGRLTAQPVLTQSTTIQITVAGRGVSRMRRGMSTPADAETRREFGFRFRVDEKQGGMQ